MTLNKKEIQFISLENRIYTPTPMGMLLFNMCAPFSEMQRELIREIVFFGIESTRKKGRKGGRPRALTDKQIIKVKVLKKSNEFSVKQICKIMNISRSVYYRSINLDQ